MPKERKSIGSSKPITCRPAIAIMECPCEFSAPAHAGYCEGLGAWRINRGKYGDVRLDGLGLGSRLAGPRLCTRARHRVSFLRL